MTLTLSPPSIVSSVSRDSYSAKSARGSVELLPVHVDIKPQQLQQQQQQQPAIPSSSDTVSITTTNQNQNLGSSSSNSPAAAPMNTNASANANASGDAVYKRESNLEQTKQFPSQLKRPSKTVSPGLAARLKAFENADAAPQNDSSFTLPSRLNSDQSGLTIISEAPANEIASTKNISLKAATDTAKPSNGNSLKSGLTSSSPNSSKIPIIKSSIANKPTTPEDNEKPSPPPMSRTTSSNKQQQHKTATSATSPTASRFGLKSPSRVQTKHDNERPKDDSPVYSKKLDLISRIGSKSSLKTTADSPTTLHSLSFEKDSNAPSLEEHSQDNIVEVLTQSNMISSKEAVNHPSEVAIEVSTKVEESKLKPKLSLSDHLAKYSLGRNSRSNTPDSRPSTPQIPETECKEGGDIINASASLTSGIEPSTVEKTLAEQRKLATFMSRFGSQKPTSPLATQPATAASTIASLPTTNSSEPLSSGSKLFPFLARLGTKKVPVTTEFRSQTPSAPSESLGFHPAARQQTLFARMRRNPPVETGKEQDADSSKNSTAAPFISRWTGVSKSPTMSRLGIRWKKSGSNQGESQPSDLGNSGAPTKVPFLARFPMMARLGTKFAKPVPVDSKPSAKPTEIPTPHESSLEQREKRAVIPVLPLSVAIVGGLSTSKIELGDNSEVVLPKPKELAVVTRTGKTLKFQKKPTPPNTPSPPPPITSATSGNAHRSSQESVIATAADSSSPTLASLLQNMQREEAASKAATGAVPNPAMARSPLGREIDPSVGTGDSHEVTRRPVTPSTPFMARMATHVAASMARMKSKMPSAVVPTPEPTDAESLSDQNEKDRETPTSAKVSLMSRIATSFASLRPAPSNSRFRPTTPTPLQYQPKHLADFAETFTQGETQMDVGPTGIFGDETPMRSPASSSELSRGSFRIRMSMGSNNKSRFFGGGPSKLNSFDIDVPRRSDLFGDDSKKSLSISSTPPPMTKREIFMAKFSSRLVTPNMSNNQVRNLEKKESLSKRVKFPDFRRSPSLKSANSTKSARKFPDFRRTPSLKSTKSAKTPAVTEPVTPIMVKQFSSPVVTFPEPVINPRVESMVKTSSLPVSASLPTPASYIPPSVVAIPPPPSSPLPPITPPPASPLPPVTPISASPPPPTIPSPRPRQASPITEDMISPHGSIPALPASSDRFTFERTSSLPKSSPFLKLGRSFTAMKQKLAFPKLHNRSVTLTTGQLQPLAMPPTPRTSNATSAQAGLDGLYGESFGQPRTDLYGFLQCQPSKSVEIREAIREREVEEMRLTQWKKAGMLVKHSVADVNVGAGGIVLASAGDDFGDLDAVKLSERIVHGIPHCWRGPAWYKVITSTSDISKSMAADELANFEKSLVQEFTANCEKPTAYADDIVDDVDSTVTVYPFRTQKLRRVLTALSHHDEKIGYSGSMRGVAAMLLLVMEEECAFVALVHLYFSPTVRINIARDANPKFSLSGYYTNGWPKFKELAFIHEQLVNAWTPQVKKKFDKNTITAVQYATQWHLTLFEVCSEPAKENQTPLIPFRIIIRLWDLLFQWGFAALPVISAAIIKIHELSLLNMDVGDILGFLRGCVEPQHPLVWTLEQEERFFKLVNKYWIDANAVRQTQPWWSASAGVGISQLERARVDWIVANAH
ncbi:UNVERIFIED_CONTAM: hypothetical protein HDU68_009585 [Siphonaria sp. JEL0065]|nr:hypothetical protein HDU68_009585 [Siphonaria sp. JEL0065]